MSSFLANTNIKISYFLKVFSLYTALSCFITSGIVLYSNFNIYSYNSKILGSYNIINVNATELINWENDLTHRYPNAKIKTIKNGIKHISTIVNTGKNTTKVNIIEINKNINEKIKISPILASEQLNSRKTVQSILKDKKTILAVNGTFFSPTTGVPLGLLKINNELLTGPIYNRAALLIFDNSYRITQPSLSIKLFINKENLLQVENINQPRMLSTQVLVYNNKWGEYSPPTPKYGIQVAVKQNKIIEISNNPIKIPKDGFVISGPKNKLKEIILNRRINLQIDYDDDIQQARHIISGGPFLVKNGHKFLNTKQEKFQNISGKNPRTAVGLRGNSEIVFVTVSGRENGNVGLTLNELADFMLSIGCTDALNLDGGSSSVMYINGQVVNKNVTNSTPVSNIIAVY